MEIRDELNQQGVPEKVKRSQVRWRNAFEGMGSERLVRRVYEADMEGRRGRGQPRKKWNDNFMQGHINAAYTYACISKNLISGGLLYM